MSYESQTSLKKKHPFEVPEQEAALNLVRTSDRLQIRFTLARSATTV